MHFIYTDIEIVQCKAKLSTAHQALPVLAVLNMLLLANLTNSLFKRLER